MTTFAFIFARGGSKGLPNKNILPLKNKPLIAWSIEHALASKKIDRVIVSTDSKAIAKIAQQYGAEVPFIRPKELSQDNSSEWQAWRHALNYVLETSGSLPDIMVSVPATAPLRKVSDIDDCIDLFSDGGVDLVVTTCNAERSPYFNMVKKNKDETIRLVIPTDKTYNHRQDVPKVFDMATVCYVAKPEFVMSHNSIFEGRVKAINIPKERAIDIDTQFDLYIAASLLEFDKNGQ